METDVKLLEQELKRIENTVNLRRRAYDEAAGRLSVLMDTLKESYGCNTVEEAEAMLAKLTSDTEQLMSKISGDMAQLKDMVTQWTTAR